nr:4Fe-4S binding protein [Lachnospiraceae bacterium]
MKQVKAAFFSPTGTTRRLVLALAGTLSEALDVPFVQADFTVPIRRQEPIVFGEDEVAVIGLPVYAGRLPNLLLPYVKTLQGHDTPAIFLTVFGNRNYDDALLELGLLLEQQGFRLTAAGAFVGEHAFSRELGAGRPDRRDIRKVREFARSAAEKIKAGQSAASVWELLREEERPLKPYYTPRDRQGNPINILKVKPKTDLSKCISCGRCVTLCPMGSIDPRDVTQYLGVCIKCGACEKGCPEGARYYDDPGYLYHKSELELQYARRAQNTVFL